VQRAFAAPAVPGAFGNEIGVDARKGMTPKWPQDIKNAFGLWEVPDVVG